MYRTAIESLYKWKSGSWRKPLLIRGARQVGKTWLMKEFAAQCYQNSVYINFDNNRSMRELFAPDFNIERIVTGLELYAGYKITPDNTLLIFDEVQEVPAALASLNILMKTRLSITLYAPLPYMFFTILGALRPTMVVRTMVRTDGLPLVRPWTAVLYVVYTVRKDDTIRLISARKANASERKCYYEANA